MADMIADKTDNVEVVVALDGSPIDDDDDIGNEYIKALDQASDLRSLILRIMYSEESRGVPLYINNYGKADHGGGGAQVKTYLSIYVEKYNSFASRVRKMSQGFHMSPPLAGLAEQTQDF